MIQNCDLDAVYLKHYVVTQSCVIPDHHYGHDRDHAVVYVTVVVSAGLHVYVVYYDEVIVLLICCDEMIFLLNVIFD